MPLHTRIYRALTNPQLRLATIIGFVSAATTIALSWGSVADERIVAGGTVSSAALLVAGFFVGYLYYGRQPDRRRVGTRTGLAASTGLVVVYLANMLSTLSGSSPRAIALTVIGTPIASALGVAIVVLIVRVAVVIGDRLAAVRAWRTEVRNTSREYRRGISHSKWWKYVAAYVVLVPVTAGYVFGIDPTNVLGILLAVLLLFVTLIAAAFALFAVYKDAEQLYDDNSPWIPNVTVYVGLPIIAYVIVSSVANFNAWMAPVAPLSFLVVCWLIAAIYLLDRRRSLPTA